MPTDRQNTRRLLEKEATALDRLIEIAQRDTNQSKYVSNFLLAWWNAAECRGFDFTDFWAVDTEIVTDMIAVIGLILKTRQYPDTLGYEQKFKAIINSWRPELKS